MFKRKSINAAALLALGAIALPAVPSNSSTAWKSPVPRSSGLMPRTALAGGRHHPSDNIVTRPGASNVAGTGRPPQLQQRRRHRAGPVDLVTPRRSGQTRASLRGLGRARTLILLNDRRLPTARFIGSGRGSELRSRSSGRSKRVEVLRDGASATYSSDAIGGVINFIARKDWRGGELSVGLETPHKVGDVFSLLRAAAGVGRP